MKQKPLRKISPNSHRIREIGESEVELFRLTFYCYVIDGGCTDDGRLLYLNRRNRWLEIPWKARDNLPQQRTMSK